MAAECPAAPDAPVEGRTAQLVAIGRQRFSQYLRRKQFVSKKLREKYGIPESEGLNEDVLEESKENELTKTSTLEKEGSQSLKTALTLLQKKFVKLEEILHPFTNMGNGSDEDLEEELMESGHESVLNRSDIQSISDDDISPMKPKQKGSNTTPNKPAARLGHLRAESMISVMSSMSAMGIDPTRVASELKEAEELLRQFELWHSLWADETSAFARAKGGENENGEDMQWYIVQQNRKVAQAEELRSNAEAAFAAFTERTEEIRRDNEKLKSKFNGMRTHIEMLSTERGELQQKVAVLEKSNQEAGAERDAIVKNMSGTIEKLMLENSSVEDERARHRELARELDALKGVFMERIQNDSRVIHHLKEYGEVSDLEFPSVDIPAQTPASAVGVAIVDASTDPMTPTIEEVPVQTTTQKVLSFQGGEKPLEDVPIDASSRVVIAEMAAERARRVRGLLTQVAGKDSPNKERLHDTLRRCSDAIGNAGLEHTREDHGEEDEVLFSASDHGSVGHGGHGVPKDDIEAVMGILNEQCECIAQLLEERDRIRESAEAAIERCERVQSDLKEAKAEAMHHRSVAERLSKDIDGISSSHGAAPRPAPAAEQVRRESEGVSEGVEPEGPLRILPAVEHMPPQEETAGLWGGGGRKWDDESYIEALSHVRMERAISHYPAPPALPTSTEFIKKKDATSWWGYFTGWLAPNVPKDSNRTFIL